MYQYPYGIVHEAKLNPLVVELRAFRLNPSAEIGGLGRHEHFWNIVNYLWPERFQDGKKNPNAFIRNPWSEKMVLELSRRPVLAILGGLNSSKCVAPNTPILMFNGEIKKASCVRVGDFLMGDDSRPRTVLKVHSGCSKMYRIKPLRGGMEWDCNENHILTLKRTCAQKKSWRRIGDVIDIPVRDYICKGPSFKSDYRLYCKGAEFPERPLEIDPQMYGIWLGDGTTKNTHITVHDKETEIIAFIKGYFTGKGYEVKRSKYGNTCPTWLISRHFERHHPFRMLVKESGSSGTKRIAKRYLINSRVNRLKLLAGLIDSDGTVSQLGTYFLISSSSDGLASDIVFLARSLGFWVSVKKKIAKCSNGKLCPYNSITICGNIEEIPTLRKKCTPRTKRKRSSGCSGFTVQDIGEGDWVGWTVDGNGRHLLGDFTVTHNTDTLAIWAIVSWLCDPKSTMVLLTSTTLGDSKRRMWSSVKKYFQASPKLPGRLVDSMFTIKTDDGSGKFDDRCGITLIAGEKKKEKEAVGKLIGVKQERLIFICDELPELSPALAEAFFSNLAPSNPGAQLVGLGNFNSIYDALGTLSTPKGGWSTVNADDEEWECERGAYCIRFDGLKSPNLSLGEDKYTFLYSSKSLLKHKEAYGENSAAFWRMCRSFPCPEGADNAIYSEADFIAGNTSEKAVWLDEPQPVMAADPSFTNGGDNFAVVWGLYGKNKNGIPTLEIGGFKYLRENMDLTKKGEARDLQTARQLAQLGGDMKIPVNNLATDASGPGGLAFASILSIFWSGQFLPVKFGERASDRPVSEDDPKTCYQSFTNKVGELWFTGRNFVRAGQIKGLPFEIAKELKSRYYTTVKAGDYIKTKIEPKVEMKLRIGFSPDASDAMLMLCELCRERFGFTPGAQSRYGVQQVSKQEKWVEQLRKAHSVYDSGARFSQSPFSYR